MMECKFYSKWIDWSMPVVVCGDFNEEPGSPSVSFWMKNFGYTRACVDQILTTAVQHARSPRRL